MEKWEKCAVRTAKKQARKAIGQEQRTLWNSRIVHNIVDNSAYQNARILMSYCAMGGEVDLQSLHQLAHQQGKRVAFPYCISTTEMIALEPMGSESWEKGRYGIWAPVPSRSHVIPPEQLELVLCPCTAFDRQGHRLGMGGGYYDRFLPRCERAVIAAVAYEVQRVDELETEPWDVAMDLIFTEAETETKVASRNGLACR